MSEMPAIDVLYKNIPHDSSVPVIYALEYLLDALNEISDKLTDLIEAVGKNY